MALLLLICMLTKGALALDVFTNFSRKELEPIVSKYKDQPLRITYGWPELLRSNIEVRKPKSAVVWLRRRQDFEIFRDSNLLQKVAPTDFPGIPEPFRDSEAVGMFIHPYVMVHAGKTSNWRSWSKDKFKGKLCGDGELAAEILAVAPGDRPQFLKVWRHQQASSQPGMNLEHCQVSVNSTAHFATAALPAKYTIQDGGRLPFSLSAVGFIGDTTEAKKFATWLISRQQKIATHFHAVATNPEVAPPSTIAKLLPKDSALGNLYAAPF